MSFGAASGESAGMGEFEWLSQTSGRALRVAGEEPVIGAARILDHQPGRVGVAQQIFAIDLLAVQQFVDQRADEQAIGAGADADPFIGNRRIAGADRD